MSRSLAQITQRLLQISIKVSKTIKTLEKDYKLTSNFARRRRWRPRERIRPNKVQTLLFSVIILRLNPSTLLASSLYSSLLIRLNYFQYQFIASSALSSLNRGVFLSLQGQILYLNSKISYKIVSKPYKSTIKQKNTYTLDYSAYYYYSNSSLNSSS